MTEEDRAIDLTKHKRRYFFKSIRFRFVFWFFVTALIPLLIIGTIAYYYGRKLETKRIYEYLASVKDTKKEHIRTFINAKKGRTIDFSSDGLIRELTKKIVKNAGPLHIESNIKKLNSHLSINKVPLDEDIIETFITNLDGKIISSSNEESMDADVSVCDYFQEGKKAVYVSRINYVPDVRVKNTNVSRLSSNYKRYYIAVAAPLKDKISNELIGVLVNKVDKNALDKIVKQSNGQEGPCGDFYLVNKDELLVAQCHTGHNNYLKAKVDSTGIQDCISGNDGIGIYNGCYSNIPVIGAYSWLDEPGWALMVEMDINEAFAPLRKIKQLIVVIAIPVLLIVIGISFLVSGRMSKPIINITDAIKNITSGDLKSHISILTNDELGEISNELNKIMIELRESNKILLHSDKLASIGRITAGVAHEVNNPLSALSGRLQLLIEENPDNALSEEYKRLLNLAMRIESTIDGLLYFSSQKDIELTTANINTVLDDSMSLIDKQMAAQGIKIYKKYETKLPQVEISIDQIQQVFFNLILNAFDSMIGKGILTIGTGLSADGKNIQVIIKDTGIGIPAKNVDKIFEPFFSTKSPDKGTGLGLSISYGIIKNHCGTIDVKSTEGEGTTFTINLPVA